MQLNKPKFWTVTRFSLWPIVLYPISILFLFITYLRSAKARLKLSKKFSIPVICVGNIYLGGTGKTPLASEIFEIIKSFGKNPGFVKKYYTYLEDEIEMLKKIGKTFISKNRSEAIKSLMENGNDVAILDDGFQDFSIKKDFSILCFNQKQWIGNGFVIPSGPLREGLSALKRADCVVINGPKDINIENEIYKKNKHIKLFYSIYKPLNIDEFKNKKIIAFSGIGNPSNFFHLLKENHISLLEEIVYPDHYNFSKVELDVLIKKANDNNATLLTTEKDYLRINSSFKKNIKYLIIKLEMENKNNFIEQIKKIL